ncbi:SipW-dependent-type signal peptide-containing protein [Nesterenkonia alba]|uniref:SipW-dependent-type signal peptide-containing protein n=1 Tax=Nesterenkonia alba TaxID=515814 RepID=UPI0003B6FC93|nr:SipW-dependent-type signal peptide-containing protein [Nesterenkonia alba]
MTEQVKKKNRNKKKLATASVAGFAGIALLGGGTLAAWNDAETARADIETGDFGIEIRTANSDGTWGDWQDGTTPGSPASLDLDGIVDDIDGHSWRPGDEITTSFQIRATEDTTHDGVISADNVGIEVDGSEYFSYEIASTDETVNLAGTFAETGDASGAITVPATGEPVDFTAKLALTEGGYAGDFTEFIGETYVAG